MRDIAARRTLGEVQELEAEVAAGALRAGRAPICALVVGDDVTRVRRLGAVPR